MNGGWLSCQTPNTDLGFCGFIQRITLYNWLFYARGIEDLFKYWSLLESSVSVIFCFLICPSKLFSFIHSLEYIIFDPSNDQSHLLLQMLALSVLDTILSMDKFQQWMTFMSSKGYLQHLVDSLLHDDQQLQTLLSPTPQLRVLYIHLSKLVTGVIYCVIMVGQWAHVSQSGKYT